MESKRGKYMKRLLSAICLLVAGVGGATIGTAHGALAATEGNSVAAAACQQTGYLSLIGTNGSSVTTFTNTGDCVSYAAQGGTLVLPTFMALGCVYSDALTFTGSGLQPNSQIYLYSIGGSVLTTPLQSGYVDQDGIPHYTGNALLAKVFAFDETLVFSAVSAAGAPLYATVVAC
jgi:hypothetical protein